MSRQVQPSLPPGAGAGTSGGGEPLLGDRVLEPEDVEGVDGGAPAGGAGSGGGGEDCSGDGDAGGGGTGGALLTALLLLLLPPEELVLLSADSLAGAPEALGSLAGAAESGGPSNADTCWLLAPPGAGGALASAGGSTLPCSRRHVSHASSS